MLRAVFRSGFLQAIGFGAGFVVHILLARLLTTDQYGIYNFIFALSGVLATIAAFGLPQATVRYMQAYALNSRPDLLKGLLLFVNIWPVILGLILGVLVYGLLSLSGRFEAYSSPELVMIGIALIPFLAFVPLQAFILRGYGKITISVFFETTFRDGFFMIFLAVAFVMGFSLDSPSQALALILGVLILRWALALLAIKLSVPKNNKILVPYAFECKTWLHTAWPMMMTVTTRVILVRTDLIVLGLMLGLASLTSQDLGIYAAAAKFSLLMVLAQMAVLPFFTTNAARLYQENKPSELAALFKRAQKLQFIAASSLLCVFILGGDLFLTALGPDYTAAYIPLMILMAGQFAGLSFGPASSLLEMTQYERDSMKVIMFFSILNLIAMPILIYTLGMHGAAISTALSFAGQNMICYFVAKKRNLF